MPESVENNVELILMFATVAMIGISVSFKPLHKWLSMKPWLGIILFMLISGALYWFWGGIWQLWTIDLMLGVLMLEYFFLTLRPNKALQVAVTFNQKLFLLCAYCCIGATILFPAFFSMDGLTDKLKLGTWKMVVESTDRPEMLDQTKGLKRRFALQLYYPVQGSMGKHKKWIEGGDKAIKGMALSYGLPEMVVSHLKTVDSGVQLSRKILQRELPYQVVVNHPYSAYAAVYNSKDYILGAKYPSAQMNLVDEKIELESQMTLVQQGGLVRCF